MQYFITTKKGQWNFNKNTGSFENVLPEKRHLFDTPEAAVTTATELMERRSVMNDEIIYQDIEIWHVRDEDEEEYEPDIVQLQAWMEISLDPVVRQVYNSSQSFSAPYDIWLKAWRGAGKPVIW